jgi:hypothetical protein
MENSPLLSSLPAIIQQAPASTVRPATSEQALAMLKLILAEVRYTLANADAKLAVTMPLHEGEAAESAAEARALHQKFQILLREYSQRYGNLDVPLVSLGRRHEDVLAALRPILSKLAEKDRATQNACM